MVSSTHLLQHSSTVTSGLFGIYLSIRVFCIRSKNIFYGLWLLSVSLIFLGVYFMEISELETLYFWFPAFLTLFSLSSALFYLAIKKEGQTQTLSINTISRHVLFPALILITSCFVSTLCFTAQVNVQLLNIISNPIYLSGEIFDISVPFLVRSFLLLVFLGYVFYQFLFERWFQSNPKRLRKSPLSLSLKTIRLFYVAIFLILIVAQGYDYFAGDTYQTAEFNRTLVALASLPFLVHVFSMLQNFSLQIPAEKVDIKEVQPVQTKAIPKIDAPEIILFALQSIYKEKLYLDPLLSVGKMAQKCNLKEEQFSKLYNDHLAFSFTSYINYLRLLYFDNHSNPKYSQQANIESAGFNSRASYYQWKKRIPVIEKQIGPILEHFEYELSQVTNTYSAESE